jgi:peptidoglycan-N-acetylglucosamine deacetylase
MMVGNTRSDPVLTIQVDVDTTVNLLAFYGFEAPSDYQDHVTYQFALPRFAELFATFGVRATFFVIGQDLFNEANQQVVRLLIDAGHEIANHTQRHLYDFAHLGRAQKRMEIEQAGQLIQRVTGQRPAGFRAPGYDADRDVLDSLVELGYLYDSSVLPSILNVPFRFLQRLIKENGTPSGYGSIALSLAPNCAYRPNPNTIWRPTSKGSLWEIPVSCVPYLRLPFYANFNLLTGEPFFRLSAALAAKRDCNYVFHAVEMLDPNELDPRLYRHPNVRLPLKEKMRRCRLYLETLTKGRTAITSREFALELEAKNTQ